MFRPRPLLSTIVLSYVIVISFIGYYQIDKLSLFRHDYGNQNLNYSTTMIRNDLRQIKNCVIRAIVQTSRGLWSNLHKIIYRCSANHGAVKRPFVEASIDKHFLLYTKNAAQLNECIVVSLGIGNEIVLEERLQSMQPFCKFYGADPFQETAEVYKSVGKVFLTAVDDESGEKFLNTLKNGTYLKRKVKTTSFGSFLKNDLHINRIHYLSVDIEGSEYRLLPYMASTGSFQEESDSTIICQFIVELHGFLPQHNFTEITFQDFFIHFLSASPYVPIKGSKPYEHNYIVFMNLEEDYCLKLFY